MSADIFVRYKDQTQDILTSVLDQSQDCIKLITKDGLLEYMNENGQHAMQIRDFAPLAGSDWITLWPAECRDQVSEAVEEARAGRRTRFEGYCPTFEGEPRWWDVSVSPIRDAAGHVTHILATSRDISHQMKQRMDDRLRRDEAEREADLAREVAAEMRHRLKNLLAVVSAINRLLVRGGGDAADQATRLQDRLQALARAQDFMTQDNGLMAGDIIQHLLTLGGEHGRITIGEIPEGRISSSQMLQLALLVGELQTNALKHGALAEEDGRIEISSWRDGSVLTTRWEERRSRPIADHGKVGSGLQMIERLGAASGKPAFIEWRENGVTVEFHGDVTDPD